MKATHVMWDDLWDKSFSNYPGLVSILKGTHSEYRLSEPEEKFYDVRDYKTSYYMGDMEELSPLKKEPSSDREEGTSVIEKRGIPTPDEPKHLSDNEQVTPPRVAQQIPVITAYDEIERTHNKQIIPPVVRENKSVDKKPTGSKPEEILFECETGQGFTFSTGGHGGFCHHRFCLPKTLGIIAIDTSCLNRPKTRIRFTSNIFFIPKEDKGTAQLEFILSRSCNNGEESNIGNWIYDIIEKKDCSSQSFMFNFCTNNSFPGFYHYFVRVLPVYVRNCAIGITQCHLDIYAQSR